MTSVAYISLNTYTYFEPCMFYSPAVWCSTSSSTCNSLSILCVLHEKRHLLSHLSFTTCFTSMPLFKAFFTQQQLDYLLCRCETVLIIVPIYLHSPGPSYRPHLSAFSRTFLSSPFICILQNLLIVPIYLHSPGPFSGFSETVGQVNVISMHNNAVCLSDKR